MKELTVKSGESGQRFDKYLARYLKEAPKSFLYKMLRKKNITLNGKKADGSEKLQAEDTIQLFFSDETLEKFMGQEKEAQVCPLEILYEDADVLFINKPVGMLSQKAKKEDVFKKTTSLPVCCLYYRRFSSACKEFFRFWSKKTKRRRFFFLFRCDLSENS